MLRLDRWLVTLGVGSRSEMQKLIRKGGVKVNDVPVRDPGQQVDEHSAQLTVNGTPSARQPAHDIAIPPSIPAVLPISVRRHCIA